MREMARKVLTGSSANAVAQMIANLSAFLLPWAIARGMGESEYGLYATAYALAVSLAGMADTGVRVTLIREVSRTPELWKFLVRYALMISLILAGLVVLAFSVALMVQDEGASATQLRFWLFGYALLWVGMRISLGVVVGHQQLVASSIWGSFERLGGMLVVMATVFVFTPSLVLIAQELLLWELFVLVVLWGWILRRPWETVDKSSVSLVDFAKAALPFGVAAVASALLSRLDLVIFGFQQSPEDVAMYAAGQVLSLTMVFVGVSIANALFPMMSSLGKDRNAETARALIEPSIALLSLLMLLGAAFISAGAETWLGWIYGDSFSPGAKWLILYALMSPIYALGAITGSVVAAWGWQPKAAKWAIGALMVSGPAYWIAGHWFGMEAVVFCVIVTQLVLTLRAWFWMVQDELVGDHWWLVKLIVFLLLLGIGIFLTPDSWDWIYVPLAFAGAILSGICRLVWLRKLKEFLLVRA